MLKARRCFGGCFSVLSLGMKLLNVSNPFGAPVYHEETVSSTMDAARVLKKNGALHGTVISADFQESGRGRQNRPWKTDRGTNLIFTIILDFSGLASIPKALTLKTGLALSLGIEDFAPALKGAVAIKWPNDVMLLSGKTGTAKKTAGILAEAQGNAVYVGVGVNLGQRDFPPEYSSKAGSILLALEEAGAAFEIPAGEARFVLLEKFLSRFRARLEEEDKEAWRRDLENRLYRRGEEVGFAEGTADSGKILEGRLEGIGKEGELLIALGGENEARAYFNGELRVYGNP
jgi:BirA family biotin operon repressor/biotin-[acetyl-CoA-carboxylase] ligase